MSFASKNIFEKIKFNLLLILCLVYKWTSVFVIFLVFATEYCWLSQLRQVNHASSLLFRTCYMFSQLVVSINRLNRQYSYDCSAEEPRSALLETITLHTDNTNTDKRVRAFIFQSYIEKAKWLQIRANHHKNAVYFKAVNAFIYDANKKHRLFKEALDLIKPNQVYWSEISTYTLKPFTWEHWIG